MLSTALLIGAVLLVIGVCTLGVISSLQRRADRTTSAPDGAAGERAEALRQRAEAMRQLSLEIEKGKSSAPGGAC